MKRAVLGAVVIAAFLISSVVPSGPASAGRLHPELDAHLRVLPPGGVLSVIVEMTVQADPGAAAATAPSRARAARRRALVDALQDVANRHQGQVHALLAREQSTGRVHRVAPFWIFNGFAVTATEPVIRALAAHADVWEVRPDRIIPPPAPVPAGTVSTAAISEWNINKVRAPEVWSLGYTGVGSVVGSFDTGVDLTHPDLASRYGGFWYDPYGEHANPFDPNSHGTHTTGTAVGSDASGKNIGVAPGATWIAAKAWNDAGVGLISAFHQIFQWFLAPGGNPANAPDVVNNSWAFTSTTCVTEFLSDVQAWRAAGIFPAFAAGNSGPSGGTAQSPGNYTESFAVGATDSSDNIASFSSRGPSPCDGFIKPDVSAPGASVNSSVPGGYATYSGTSMATPHVAGAVALLRSINPNLTVDQLESALTQGSVDLGTGGSDNNFGVGRLDLFQSAQLVIGGAGPTPPDTLITATPPALSNGSASFSFTATKAGSTFACRLDGGGFAGCSSPQTYSGLPNGSHTFQVQATDQAGTTDPTPATYTWTVDATPPVISAVTALPGSGGTASISWNTNEASDSRVDYGTVPTALTLNATNATRVTPHSITLAGLTPNTIYYYRVTSRDAVGNASTSPPSSSAPASFLTLSTTTVTAFPASTTILTGTLRGGTGASLNADDNNYFEVNSTTSGTRTSSWYAAFTGVSNALSNLKITYTGKNSRSCTQTVSIWRWTTSSWVQLDSRSVGTTEVLIANLVPSGTLADYVSGGELRVRIRCTRTSGNFFSSGDLIKIVYDMP